MLTELPLLETEKRRGILDVPDEELAAWLAQRNEKPLRIRQIRRWILHSRATSFEQMSDLPKQLREALAESFVVFSLTPSRHLISKDQTHKLLLETQDKRTIECVLIQEEPRRTACISTQVGCGMGCVFCASGLNGVERNLTAAEILEQLVQLRNLTPPPEGRLTNVVVMGMGEPMANLENLLAALEMAGRPDGLNLGARHITISTVGLPAKMRKLADTGKQYHLAVSLHAPNDELRSKIVPTNDKTGIPEIMAAADYFFEKTGRQVTYEYVLLGQLNDSPKEARELASLVQGRVAHVNLIPFNDVEGLPWKRPTQQAQTEFINILRQSGVSVKVRKRKGSDIDAACGQLRRKVELEKAAAGTHRT